MSERWGDVQGRLDGRLLELVDACDLCGADWSADSIVVWEEALGCYVCEPCFAGRDEEASR